MVKSLYARVEALEAQAAPQDCAPRVIFLSGLRPHGDASPHNYASTGHVRFAHEDMQEFMRRIRMDIEAPDRVQLVFLADKPEWPRAE